MDEREQDDLIERLKQAVKDFFAQREGERSLASGGVPVSGHSSYDTYLPPTNP